MTVDRIQQVIQKFGRLVTIIQIIKLPDMLIPSILCGYNLNFIPLLVDLLIVIKLNST